jgi:hypothetical protein
MTSFMTDVFSKVERVGLCVSHNDVELQSRMVDLACRDMGIPNTPIGIARESDQLSR